MTTRSRLPLLFALSLTAACHRQPDLSADAREAMALSQQILAAMRAHGPGGEALAEEADRATPPPPKGRAPDSVDVMSLVSEAEVAAILKQRRAGGDATDTGSFVVRKKKVPGNGAPGYGSSMCEFQWVAKDAEGMVGAQGSFALTVLDLQRFEWEKDGNDKRFANLGDEAVDSLGIAYVRVGDVAITVTGNSGSGSLARLVLAAAVPRLR